jgi:putative GTP pyrophosphokinase
MLATRVESIIREVLDQNKINYHTITHRTKTLDGYEKKAEKYPKPREEIMDMAGIRVITYIDSDAKKVEELTKSLFYIIPEHCVDKTKELGTDKVGYRSVHIVGTIGDQRSSLPENKNLANLRFEIQIRTILQHAWAEFEHDRNYKFSGVLPDEIKRRLAITAGNLELIDWTFESISHEIDQYVLEVEKKTAVGNLDTPITTASLTVYFEKKFSELIGKPLNPTFNGIDNLVIRELSAVGIKTLQQLDNIIPKDFSEIFLKYKERSNYSGLLRSIMIIHDSKAYFEKAWSPPSWSYLHQDSVDFLTYYNVPIRELIERHKLKISRENKDRTSQLAK